MGRSNTGRKQSKISTAIILITLLLLVVVVLVKSIQLREKKAELQVQAAEITAQIEDAQNEHKKLEEKEDYMKTKKYVEDVARNQLGLVYPDEIVIRPEE
ncbi:septum formation initiator family protein [Coprococcus eutactus]|uniref:Septum formation initiator family protein n=2 Tax=Coprococcus TaxID=33042 RepID=A0A8I0AJY2_9FIRM|nr:MULTISPECIES: septum formation initiator family protein [Clostridia]MDD6464323.1 septum formation initiator family protein [Coprococcus sp.]RHV79319.1 septum formation initiator family protein [Clostridium sp. OF10-22XD]MBC5662251.1 septum formation initiator family protein [Coprococcus hominis (ex Liu et al. 2022)]MCB5505653.1 septum formation initiator family protein [Coprococcus eutactus]MCU6731986.1 septum formation initiator family protein [Coprococcus ammoniilyticus]